MPFARRLLIQAALLVLCATSGAAAKFTSAFIAPSTSIGGSRQYFSSTSPRPVASSGVKQSRVRGVSSSSSSSSLKAAAKGGAKKKTAAKKKGTTEDNFKKSDFVNSIAERTGFTKVDSEEALNAVLDILTEQLCSEKKVPLFGFGTFQVKDRAARKGRNPQTGEEIEIAASKSPTFTASKALKDKVNGRS